MNEVDRIEALRATYRQLWDAHQLIAHKNARIVEAGQQPSSEQLIEEQRAARAVELARNELRAATS